MRCSVAERPPRALRRMMRSFGELLDFGGGGLVEVPAAPVLDQAVPVGAVDAAGSGADGCADDRDVLGEGSRGALWGCGG
jgi:hypothetical protein